MKFKKLTVFCLVTTIILTQFQSVSANKLQDAQNEKKKAQENYDNVQGDINTLENKKTSIQADIDKLDSDLGNVIIEMSKLEEKLTKKEEQLAAVKEELDKAREDEKEQYDAMKKRIKFMYERGDTAFITSILESKSVSQLLNQVEYYNEVYDYDRTLLINYQKTKLEIEELEKLVEQEIAELETERINYMKSKENYEALLAERKVEKGNFQAKLDQATKLASDYMDAIHAQDAIIKAEERRIAEEEEARREAARQEAARREREAQEQREREQQAVASNSGSSSSSSSDKSTGGGGNANPAHSTNVSGQAVVNYGLQFVGNPYVWGGNDPNTGADCSGFVKYVFANFGISLPRTSYALRSVGREVSYANAQAGDLICYEGHVAIYMGGGQIVHAKGTAYGIVTGSATYKSIITVRRVL